MNTDEIVGAGDAGCSATAVVVKGGNIRYEIRAHVVCRDRAGNVRWEDDAIAYVDVPAGDPVPVFTAEGVQLRESEHKWE